MSVMKWSDAAMREAGLGVVLLETWHMRNAFEAMPVRTDRTNAPGIRSCCDRDAAGALHARAGIGHATLAAIAEALPAARKTPGTQQRDLYKRPYCLRGRAGGRPVTSE
jgi:hypothetical protein